MPDFSGLSSLVKQIGQLGSIPIENPALGRLFAGLMKYDLIVIGGGPAGYVGAIRAAQLGKKVAAQN